MKDKVPSSIHAFRYRRSTRLLGLAAKRAILVMVSLCWLSGATAETVEEELSHKSGIPLPELRAMLSNCDGPQLNMNMCAWRDFLVADRELNKTYKSALNLMKTSEAVKRLRDSQRAWLAFRDLNCPLMVGPPGSGGSLHAALWSLCLANMTKDRTSELNEILNCVEDPCPPKE